MLEEDIKVESDEINFDVQIFSDSVVRYYETMLKNSNDFRIKIGRQISETKSSIQSLFKEI